MTQKYTELFAEAYHDIPAVTNLDPSAYTVRFLSGPLSRSPLAFSDAYHLRSH